MRWTIGIAALFLGGLAGGVLGAALFRSAPAEPRSATPAAAPAAGPAVGDDALALAIRDLRLEIRDLRAALTEPRPDSARTPAGAAPAGPDQERLVAALEALARALSPGARPGSTGTGRSAPLIVPRGPPRHDLLRDVRAMDEEQRGRTYRFLTYQEVLDRFGRPDQVYRGGQWMYEDPDSGDEITFYFEDGLLLNIR